MQSIERYGVVALCFLIVSLVAVWLWDDQVIKAGGAVVQASETAKAQEEAAQREPAQRAKGGRRNKKYDQRGVSRAGLRTQAGIQSTEAAVTGSLIASQTGVEAGPLTPEKIRKRRQSVAQADLERTRAEDEADRIAWQKQEREAQESQAAPGASFATRDGARPRSDTTRDAELPSLTEVNKGMFTKPQTVSPKRRASNGGLRPYVIRPGDTLSEISQRELGTMHRMNEIVAVNAGLNANRLPVGVEIQLPTGKGPSGATRTNENTSQSAASSGKGRFIVGSGDSLWVIAQREFGDGSRWQEIARLNPAIDPERLTVGEVLVMPEGTRTPSNQRSVPKVANREQVRSRGRGKVL